MALLMDRATICAWRAGRVLTPASTVLIACCSPGVAVLVVWEDIMAARAAVTARVVFSTSASKTALLAGVGAAR